MRWFANSSTDRVSERDALGPLLPPALLAALSGLDLVSAARRRRSSEGVHPALRHGREEEFFQHRPYVRGDDLRAVDWRASARTGHPLLKERHQPARRPLTLLLDTTLSMDFPDERSKLRQAKVLAAALAFLALRRGDSVEILVLRDAGFERVARLRPAPRALHAISSVLEPLEASGESDVAASLERTASSVSRHGLAVLLSDLYGDEGRLFRALSTLRRLTEVAVVHVLAAAEKEIPAGPGTGALRELEGGAVVSVDAGATRAHRVRVAQWRDRLRGGAAAAGAEFVDADPGEPAVDVLTRWLGRIP